MENGSSSARAQNAGSKCDVLLTGATVVTVDDERNVFAPGTVAISGGTIVAVGPAQDFEDWEARKTIDCAGKILMPGFIDGHSHLYQSLAKGLGEGLSIVPWLCEFMWPYSIGVSPDDAVIGAQLGAVQALRTGITTIIDNHYAPTDVATTLAVADAIEGIGLRGAVARGIVGQASNIARKRGQPAELFRYTSDEEIGITRECIESRGASARVQVWPAPLNLTYVEPSLVRSSIALAREHGTSWHTHCCEGKGDPEAYVEEYGSTPVQWLTDNGLLDSTATLAHAIWLTEREVDDVASRGARVAHNPASNAYLGSGTMALLRMMDLGVPISLGTDGPSCGHRADMFEAMKLAVFTQRIKAEDPSVIRAEQALEIATRYAAQYAGVNAGVLEAGRMADIVAIDMGGAHLNPVHRAVSAIVYSATPSDIAWTMVGGDVIYDNGVVTHANEQDILDQAQLHSEQLLARAGMAQLSVTWNEEVLV